MENRKMPYGEASLEIILLRLSDILTASGDDIGDDSSTPPSSGDWDHEGWINW